MTTNVPAALQDFVGALERYRQSTPRLGVPFLKFIKTGEWLLGVNNEPVAGAIVAITLKQNAARTPSPIRVHMLGLR